jgi:hypothetical protein
MNAGIRTEQYKAQHKLAGQGIKVEEEDVA